MSTQLEINNILASTGTFSSGLIVSNQTANTVVSFDTNKSIISLSTSTYPSLTEFSYVKGITSAVQTQIDNKASTSHTHTASNISDSTTAGRALLTATDAASQRTSLGLGTLATQNGTFSGTSSGTNTGDQTISVGGDVTAAGSTGSLTATVTKINGVSLAGLSTGLLKNTTSTGQPTIAVAGTDYAVSVTAGSGISVSSTAGAYTINAKVYSTTIGDGSSTSYTVTHNLSVSNDVHVSVRDTGTNYYVYPDIKYSTANAVIIEFISAPTSNQYRVSIIGF